jgi:surfactin synthase thioesterase subunit
LRCDVFDAADLTYFGLMSRYVPPRLDVPVTCFIAEQGRHFDTDPAAWRGLATEINQVSLPGTHLTSVVSQRQALAAALAQALQRATVRDRRARSTGGSAGSAPGGALSSGA